MKSNTFLLLPILALIGACDVIDGPHPLILTRTSAAKAIQSTSEFQHKTKLRFEIGQFEALIPPSCNNFAFVPEHVAMFKQYLKTGAMQFSPYGHQSPPFRVASAGTYDLADSLQLLIRRIDICGERPVRETDGEYELTIGDPGVEVTGIRKIGAKGLVDFRWRFNSLNEVGRSLIARQKETWEMRDSHLTAEEKLRIPFWIGSAEFASYDDGWRVVKIDLTSHNVSDLKWEYGPDWPDPSFNWNAFDENKNRY